MKIVKLRTFDCIYSMNGAIKFSTKMKIAATSGVLKIKIQCARFFFFWTAAHPRSL